MNTYLPRRGHSDQESDTRSPLRASRFDQRGIALQTVIIMVVLLAIAGGVAAVLLNRGSQASSQLEAQAVSVATDAYTTQALCTAAGHTWHPKLAANTSESATDLNGDGDTSDNWLKDAAVCLLN